jgi:hypothetical protein
MQMRFIRPTVTPIVRFGEQRPDTWFRVTQRFDDLDSYWSKDPTRAQQKHRATDIGDGRCGSPLVAMHDGKINHLEDNATAYGAPNNALGVRLDCGNGVTIEYWHLASRPIRNGTYVKAGTIIGILGNTGLGQVCHCHIAARYNGVLFNIEDQMFGIPLDLGEEDDMKISGKFLRHINGAITNLTTDANMRAGVIAGEDDTLHVLPSGEAFRPVVVVEGRAVGTSEDKAEWYGGIKTERGGSPIDAIFGYVHSSVLTRHESGRTVLLTPTYDASGEVYEETRLWEEWLARSLAARPHQ